MGSVFHFLNTCPADEAHSVGVAFGVLWVWRLWVFAWLFLNPNSDSVFKTSVK